MPQNDLLSCPKCDFPLTAPAGKRLQLGDQRILLACLMCRVEYLLQASLTVIVRDTRPKRSENA